MKSSAFGRWIGALVLCAIVVALCVQFVDRPIALFANAHLAAKNSLATSLDLVLLFVPLGALTILGCGCTVLAGRSLTRLAEATMLAGFSLMWALASTAYLLKPAFGRIEIATYLAHPNLYGFKPFHGNSNSGFPSGHVAIATSFLLVFWVFYPRARILIGTVIGAVMIGLVLATWHFVSDVVGGLFVGATAAEITIALFRPAPASAGEPGSSAWTASPSGNHSER